VTDARVVNWLALTEAERAAAIYRLTAEGWSDFSIATATRLSVEAVQAIREQHPEAVMLTLGEIPSTPAPAFGSFPREVQEGAVCVMASHGMPDALIAAGTALSVEEIRLIRARRMLSEATA